MKIMQPINRLFNKLSLKQTALLATVMGTLLCATILFALKVFDRSLTSERAKSSAVSKNLKTNFDRETLVSDSENLQLVTEDSVIDIRDLVDLQTEAGVLSDEELEKISRGTQQTDFVGMIPEHRRPITIPIDNNTGIDGSLNPGNYVDLMLVTQEVGGVKVQPLLKNIMLVALDKPRESDENRENLVNTAKVALKDDEISQVIAAIYSGSIYLIPHSRTSTFDRTLADNQKSSEDTQDRSPVVAEQSRVEEDTRIEERSQLEDDSILDRILITEEDFSREQRFSPPPEELFEDTSIELTESEPSEEIPNENPELSDSSSDFEVVDWGQ